MAMKRWSRPEPSAESPAPPRRRRALSEDERVLWESVAKQTKPLRKKPRAVKAQAPPSIEEKVAAPPAAGPKHLAVTKPAKILRPAPPVPPLAPLGRRERSQLSRGRKDIDARLDLHGMTQTRAHHALFAFLQRANSDGLTFVLVITGKGRVSAAESERGVLRRQVPQWLSLPEFRALVVGFEEAHIGHGGEGALYVRVRRRARG
jgi:DNA-nicking Smr family endonuclease